jgi:hypothetical protein
MVNLPLGDTAAVRIVCSFINDSGWVDRRVIADGAVAVDPGVCITRASPRCSRLLSFVNILTCAKTDVLINIIDIIERIVVKLGHAA